MGLVCCRSAEVAGVLYRQVEEAGVCCRYVEVVEVCCRPLVEAWACCRCSGREEVPTEAVLVEGGGSASTG